MGDDFRKSCVFSVLDTRARVSALVFLDFTHFLHEDGLGELLFSPENLDIISTCPCTWHSRCHASVYGGGLKNSNIFYMKVSSDPRRELVL